MPDDHDKGRLGPNVPGTLYESALRTNALLYSCMNAELRYHSQLVKIAGDLRYFTFASQPAAGEENFRECLRTNALLKTHLKL